MPGIVQVKVVSARDLPIMDRSSELTDAFVEVRMSCILILFNAHVHVYKSLYSGCLSGYYVM